MEIADWVVKFIVTNGVLGVLVLFGGAVIVGGFKRIWVWGWYAKQCEDLSKTWEERYFKQVEKTDIAVQATRDLAASQAAYAALQSTIGRQGMGGDKRHD